MKKQSRFEWVKAEFARAHTILHKAASHPPTTDHLGHPPTPPGSQHAGLLGEVCALAPPPPFLEAARRARGESEANLLDEFGRPRADTMDATF